MNDYIKLINEMLDKVNTMETKKFYALIGLSAFGLLLFALPDIITAIRWW